MQDAILHWNALAIEATRVDYSTPDPAISPTPEQLGATRVARLLAIVHLAMYDAYEGVRGGPTYLAYSASDKPRHNDLETARAAVASAAALTLISMYHRQRDSIRQAHVDFLATSLGRDPAIARGVAWGELVAKKMLEARQRDGSEASEDFYAPSSEPLRHRLAPRNPTQGFQAPLWGKVTPFGINELTTRVPGLPPPLPSDPIFVADFNEVKAYGVRESDLRTGDQKAIGIFWSYGGARNIGVPQRLYNQVVRAIARKKGTNEAQNARLFAVVNVAMADANIQAFAEKYKFDHWRPAVGIREASVGYGPTGQGNGNPETIGDGGWLPLASPRTNQPSLAASTPNSPSYPSAHATVGTAALHAARRELDLDESFSFEAESDELNGTSLDEDGSQRVRNVRHFTIDRAIDENLSSRVYLGVHWRYDGREGRANGLEIAEMIHRAFPARA